MLLQGPQGSVAFDGRVITFTTKRYGAVSAPISSVAGVVMSETGHSGGIVAVSVLDGPTPTMVPPSALGAGRTPYCMAFGRNGRREAHALVREILAAKPLTPRPLSAAVPMAPAQPVAPAMTPTQPSMAFPQTAPTATVPARPAQPMTFGLRDHGRRLASFKGDDGTKITLYEHALECKDEIRPFTGVSIDLVSGSELQSRVTATRLLLLGVFAFAFKKSKGGEKYLTVEGPDFAWMTEVGNANTRKAMDFINKVRNQSRRG